MMLMVEKYLQPTKMSNPCIQPLDMGFYATIKKRFRSWRRDWLVDNNNTPTMRDILREVVNQMAKVAPSVNRSFWKVAGLVDAVDADESEVGEILDLRRDNEVEADDRLSEEFGQTESDTEDEEPELSEKVQAYTLSVSSPMIRAARAC